MELYDVMLKRRSIRKYTSEEIPEEKLKKIIETPCRFDSCRAKVFYKNLLTNNSLLNIIQ